MRFKVRVEEADFDLGEEMAALRAGSEGIGGIAAFVGTVRDRNEGARVAEMYLEHYPGMTERAIGRIVEEAGRRWRLEGVRVVHRVGRLRPGDQIVCVVVAAAHRGEAFAACEFVMDYLKTQAPFWKKELGEGGARWVAARASDDAAAARWAGGAVRAPSARAPSKEPAGVAPVPDAET